MIVDFGTGRFVGGHNEDYLTALQQALGSVGLRTVAPFRNGLRLGRVERYAVQLRTFLDELGRRGRGRTVIVSHSPEFADIALFWLATKITRRSDAVGVFVLRRPADGIVGRDNWKSKFLERIAPGLIRSGWIYPVSDSRSALAHWTGGTGASGSLIAIPRPLGSSAPHLGPTGGPVVGLVGRLRVEKGARLYDTTIRAALGIDQTATVRVQVSGGLAGEEGEIARRLQIDWATEPRVEILTGHLTPDAYAALITSTDVIVLPYDAAAYAGGTSGVMHDALALGRVVLAAPIEWAVEAFAGQEDVIWLERSDPSAIRDGLEAAFRLALARRAGRNTSAPPDTFVRDWLEAIRAATSTGRHVGSHG